MRSKAVQRVFHARVWDRYGPLARKRGGLIYSPAPGKRELGVTLTGYGVGRGIGG